MTTLRHNICRLLFAGGLLVAGGCGNEAALSPTPTRYRWTPALGWRVEFVSQALRGSDPIMRYEESKIMRLRMRDDETYLLLLDGVLKTSQEPGGPVHLIEYSPGDTLGWFARLGPLGEVSDVQPGCDPSLEACRGVLLSSLPLQLRRIIPKLPEWTVPRGTAWTDTLAFDDVARPGGTRGTVITTYAVTADSVVGGNSYWVIVWRSVRRAYLGSNRGIAALTPVEESGMSMVDKESLLPAYSTWAGAAVATAELQAAGATATGFRGRAYLVNSVFDSLLTAPSSP